MLQGKVKQLQSYHNSDRAIPSQKLNTSDSNGLLKYFKYGSPVTVSPYVGLRPAFDASDLVTYLPSMNEDLKVLQQRQKLEKHLAVKGVDPADRPMLTLSGHVEGRASWNQGYARSNVRDINLSGAQLEALATVSPWATGMLVLSYDDGAKMNTGSRRVENSRIYLDRAFLTVGQLAVSPLYFTVGQIYIPFGVYNNYMVTTPLIQSLMRIKQRAALVGFDKNGIYGSVYAFHGDSYDGNSNVINDYGFNLGYERKNQTVNSDIGIGVINNIADASGMQNTSASTGFLGFGQITTGTPEKLGHLIPAIDVHAKASYQKWSMFAEYITALQKFSSVDIAFNGRGAKVAALEAQAGYNFNLKRFPANIAVGYGRTWDALAFNLPQQSVFAKAGISLFKDTIESIEYRHDINYKKTDSYSGTGVATTNPTGHRSNNIVTAQIGVYF